MTRFARVVAVGRAHHVVHRGNRRQTTYFSEDDRSSYLELLGKHCRIHALEIWAYCLMPNHVHLIAVPLRPESLAKGIGQTHWRHAQWVNNRTRRTGHLWENRFYSCPLDDEHLLAAARYVERNPVKAGIVATCSDYRWSSARAHCLGTADPLLAESRPFPGAVDDWTRWIDSESDPEQIEKLRRCTRTGRPAGSVDFVRTLEVLLGRSLLDRRMGPRESGDSLRTRSGHEDAQGTGPDIPACP